MLARAATAVPALTGAAPGVANVATPASAPPSDEASQAADVAP
jgi:hypothetical protein